MSCPRCGAQDFSGVCSECGFPVFQKRLRKRNWIDFSKRE